MTIKQATTKLSQALPKDCYFSVQATVDRHKNRDLEIEFLVDVQLAHGIPARETHVQKKGEDLEQVINVVLNELGLCDVNACDIDSLDEQIAEVAHA